MNNETLAHELVTEYDLERAIADLLLDLEAESRRFGHGRTDAGPAWWRLVRREVYVLLCTDDPKYQKERKHLALSVKPAVATLTAFLVHTLGLEHGLAASYAALALLLPLKVSKNVWCQAMSEDAATSSNLEHTVLRELHKRSSDAKKQAGGQ